MTDTRHTAGWRIEELFHGLWIRSAAYGHIWAKETDGREALEALRRRDGKGIYRLSPLSDDLVAGGK